MNDKQRRICETVLAAVFVAFLVAMPNVIALLQYVWHCPRLATAACIAYLTVGVLWGVARFF